MELGSSLAPVNNLRKVLYVIAGHIHVFNTLVSSS